MTKKSEMESVLSEMKLDTEEDIDYDYFLGLHKPQLVVNCVPEHFWRTLARKLREQIFDAGNSFQIVQIDYEEDEKMPYDPLWALLSTKDMLRTDGENIFLIDHAWTFRFDHIKSDLRNNQNLLKRMCTLMQVTGMTAEERIEKVCKEVWRYAHPYSLEGHGIPVETKVPVWYVMDELGSAVTHGDCPIFKILPFLHLPDQVAYSIMYPIEDIDEGDPITRNFVEGKHMDFLQRNALLIPWTKYFYFDIDITPDEPGKNYFRQGHINETLPSLETLTKKHKHGGRLKVFSEYDLIGKYLTDPAFEIVHNEKDADILWYLRHFKTYEELSTYTPHKYVNQFPYEHCITIKDLLAIVSRRSASLYDQKDDNKLETLPPWLPATYNMKTELVKLVACYEQRRSNGLDNYWICKPYNLARGLDTHITNNLSCLCRLAVSGPKIAQKYIENPVLFERLDVGFVKFDVRYVILLKSVNPTEVYVYKNFFLRFANKPFSMDNFDDYEKHFTVMNYADGKPLYKMLCHDFKKVWSKYCKKSWDDVEPHIFKVFKEVFTAATSEKPPLGIGESPQSRALYAADVMLAVDERRDCAGIQPKLLEINWMPDCARACEYYPQFYNDIFSVLFLDKEVETIVKIL